VARIVIGSYMIRYPLGGMVSWVLQYLVGFQRLGHDVWFVERADWPDACFDPVRGLMTDDPSAGITAVAPLLDCFGLRDHWCFVDRFGRSYGVPLSEMHDVLERTDLYIDMGVHGGWSEEAASAGRSVLIDGEPGFTQMKMVQREGTPAQLPPYDSYYSTGRNIGTPASSAPSAGKAWRPLFHPVVLDLFPATPVPEGAPITTVMNWQSYEPLVFEGTEYGHKAPEFERFLDLPGRCRSQLEAAVAGHAVPWDRLHAHGWRTRNAHDVTRSFDAFREYIQGSSAEFGVCKSGYVATHSGWFSDRSAAYLASGRPVVLQDTGFGDHLPTGRGLFAAATVDQAAAAIGEIEADPVRHSRWAREVAAECLEASVVLPRFLVEVGL